LSVQWLASGVADLAEPVHANDHACGPTSALVTLVEYGDFDCLSCAQAHLVIRDLWARFAPYLRVVFRHSPRSFDHPDAALAAEAAEAAAEQGKFWEMHDCLFQHQGAIRAGDLLCYAKWLGLDTCKFAEDLHGRSHRARIVRDQLTGIRSRVFSRPAFFINGTRFFGSPDSLTLGSAISQTRESAMQALREEHCATNVDALNRLLALTTALRDTYKRQYWQGLTLPFVGLRMILGAHTREQTDLIDGIVQRLKVMAHTPGSQPETDATQVTLQALRAEVPDTKSCLACLLDAHQSVLIGAHTLAHSLSNLDDAESHDMVVRRIAVINERQAVSLTKQLLSERSGT
jgi:DNA-binding ferritin-like protein